MNSIIYSIETNPEYYTNEDEDEKYIEDLTDNIDEHARDWMTKFYPNVEFDTQFVPESESYNNKSRVFGDEQEAALILESLENYVGNNLGDWWPTE